MKTAVRDLAELRRLLDLPPAVGAACDNFPLFVPRPYLGRIRRGDPRDPLLAQVLPTPEEYAPAAGFVADPVGDAPAQRAGGLLHKYAGRVLLVTTGACAVHCRYCFRRHFPYGGGPRSLAAWAPALDYIAGDESVREVILSGGDPLSVADALLAELAGRIARIEHVQRLRVHTRLPIMIPQRVTPELLDWLRGTRLTPVMVVHVNHPAELDDSVAAALAAVVDAGVPVLNQAVLLAGVNDAADVLVELSNRLVDLRVMPYYLHQLDRVAGAAHFEVPVQRGRELMECLRARLPGYAVPRYVLEVAGAANKVPLEMHE